MKIKFTLGVCAIALLTACGGGNSSYSVEENKIDPKPYNDSLTNFIKENRVKLDSLLAEMETFAKDASAGKHKLNYKFKFSDSTLNFKPYDNDYSFASPSKEFNAIYLSDNALLGTALPEKMTEDIFVHKSFDRFKQLVKTGKYDHSSSYGDAIYKELHNDRTLLESYLNLKYLVYVKNTKYTGGVIS